MVKTLKQPRVRKVCFHTIPLRTIFIHDGARYMKVSPRKGMLANGQLKSFKDADLVTK